MTTPYFRPLLRIGRTRSPGAYDLAGGWCWFDQVEAISRTATSEIISASDVPSDVMRNLTQSRAPIAALDMSSPQLMGILNVTPDSFSDGGLHDKTPDAVSRAGQMIADGATIIDIGGESTRPGADYVPAAAEIERTCPAIAAIRATHEVTISIDTRKAEVAEAASDAGATMFNDVSGLSHDDEMANVVARAGHPVCIMHAQGDPKTMQDQPTYDDVLLDVYDYLAERIQVAVQAGINKDKIVIDPGIGFGKTLEHNLRLLEGLSLFHALGCPILLGASRKRFIGTLGHAAQATDRLGGSIAVALFGINQGVQILRVHDTFETKQAIDLHMAMIGATHHDA